MLKIVVQASMLVGFICFADVAVAAEDICTDFHGKYAGECLVTEKGKTTSFNEKIVIKQRDCEEVKIRDRDSFNRSWGARWFTLGETRTLVDKVGYGPRHQAQYVVVNGKMEFEENSVLAQEITREVYQKKQMLTLTLQSKFRLLENGDLAVSRVKSKQRGKGKIQKTEVQCTLERKK